MVESFTKENGSPAGIDIRALKQIFAAWGGWVMDGYTSIAFLLVAFFPISYIMFPASLGYWRLVLALVPAAFAGIGRPIGSLVLGNFLGDRVGRKTLLTVSILGFSLFSASKGLLPTYDQAGILAPVLLYIILFLEGVFAGAEYGAGAALSLESVSKERRNLVGAFVQSGFGTGYFLIVLADILITSGMSTSALMSYGWRYLFFTTLIPGVLTLVIRLTSFESTVFTDMKKSGTVAKVPVKSMVSESGSKVIYALMITTGLLFINTATFSFWPVISTGGIPGVSFPIQFLGFASSARLDALLIINFVSLIGVWLGGILANWTTSRRFPMLIYAAIFTLPSAAFVYLGYSQSVTAFTIVFSIQAFLEAMIFSTLPAFLSETFSKKYRSTAIGFVYNSGALLGGFALILVLIPTYYVDIRLIWSIEIYLAAFLMLAGIYLVRERKGQKVDSILE